MEKKKQEQPRQENDNGKVVNPNDRQNVVKAHEEADKDIAADPDFSAHSPNDDLDEGESARLGENNTGLI
jgi:hypothetical protein